MFYTLDRSGRIVDRQQRRWQGVERVAGSHRRDQYERNTTDLVPGMNYVTLFMEGEHTVKKAVQVMRVSYK